MRNAESSFKPVWWECAPLKKLLHQAVRGFSCRFLILSSFLPSGFPWGNLDAGSTIVDVGGGIGMVSVEIAKEFPELKFIVQDLPDVSGQAREVSSLDLFLSKFADVWDISSGMNNCRGASTLEGL
jgi:O-methyltransferase domain